MIVKSFICRQYKRGTGKETSHQTNAYPSCHAPAKAGEKGSETASDEEGVHEDGAHFDCPFKVFRNLPFFQVLRKSRSGL